ncbi:uncharacterized protein LOC136713522 [Amia ocellicauda]|uniref:uncharacterized protein LOC136713522 n=1 Tax=Amia ocellicauda TaxID=2972642 RepID=UPI003463AD4F
MGCCSVTARHSGTDPVGADEIELLEVQDGRLWSLAEVRQPLAEPKRTETGAPQSADPPCGALLDQTFSTQEVLWGQTKEDLHHKIYTQHIEAWEGQPVHSYGEIAWSSLVSLHNRYTQESCERYLVLFSFHLLILALDDSKREFIYQGILPLSGMSVHAITQDNAATDMFEISGPMVDSKIVICANPAELRTWLDNIQERIGRATSQQLCPFNSILSFLVPCDEKWKKEELKRYLLRTPIWNWEGKPIQHLGPVGYLSLVHISGAQRTGSKERLLVIFPQDLLLLSIDSQRVQVRYEGRLPLKSIKALERSALPGRLEFEITGDMMEPMLVTCTTPGDYQSLTFQLQQPEEIFNTISKEPPPLIPKKRRI